MCFLFLKNRIISVHMYMYSFLWVRGGMLISLVFLLPTTLDRKAKDFLCRFDRKR